MVLSCPPLAKACAMHRAAEGNGKELGEWRSL